MTAELVDEIAADLGVSREARKKWRQRHSVAHRWRLPIMREAERRGVELPEDVFEEAAP